MNDHKIKIDSFYFTQDFSMNGDILGMMRVSTIDILFSIIPAQN